MCMGVELGLESGEDGNDGYDWSLSTYDVDISIRTILASKENEKPSEMHKHSTRNMQSSEANLYTYSEMGMKNIVGEGTYTTSPVHLPIFQRSFTDGC